MERKFGGDGVKVLFIDDQVNEMLLFRRKFPEVSFHWLSNAYDALDLLKAGVFEYDLVLCDVVGTHTEADNLGVLRDIADLHPNVLMTSVTSFDFGPDYNFLLKSDLEPILKEA